ncbi:CPBP family intramembrane glutamic endopeptidase [Mycobacterium sp.]|uniref:CPBP family intramembrane glutamic endopeptidase n=1 Tax=Mycobacterium sp. TaxID=1785 RepID=UPI003BAD3D3E
MTAADGEFVVDRLGRRALQVEVVIVLVVTFGLSAVSAVLRLIDSVLRDLGKQAVQLHPRQSQFDLIDLGLNLTVVAQLLAWGALGLYLLWRSGYGPARVGLDRYRVRADLLSGVGLAALIGVPGLGQYVVARTAGLNVSVIASSPADTWWRVPELIAFAFANGWAEEVIVVAYLGTRLRQLGSGNAGALIWSSLLRGAYHLYQGWGSGLGNLVMGLAFGYAWQRTGRLWPLIIAHGIIDTVVFVGYSVAARHLGWLR